MADATPGRIMEPSDFFSSHAYPLLLLGGLALFPRITLLFVAGPFSALAWLGWVFTPHLLVAFIATTRYWDTNPGLCVVAWAFAFVGTGGDGRYARRWGWKPRARVPVVEGVNARHA